MQIGIAAHSDEVPEDLKEKAEKILALIKERCEDPVLILGGYWGFMKHIVDQAVKLNMKVVLILPVEQEDVELPKGVISIRSGEEYRARSVPLVRSSDKLIVFGGSAGTIIEALMGYAMGKEVLILSGNGLPSDRLECFGNFVDQRKSGKFLFFTEPEELVNELCRSVGRRTIFEKG